MPQQVLTAGRLHRGAVDVRGGQRRRGAPGVGLHNVEFAHVLALSFIGADPLITDPLTGPLTELHNRRVVAVSCIC